MKNSLATAAALAWQRKKCEVPCMVRFGEQVKSKQHWYDLPISQAEILSAIDQGYTTVAGIKSSFLLDQESNCRCPLCSLHDGL
jgi:hypothetical protein